MNELHKISSIGKKYNLLLVYLFGSKALGKESKLSDIDIAVLLKENGRYNLRELMLDLIFEFGQIFHSDKIDLLILNKASYAIQYGVISEGKLLYQTNPEIRSQYETRIIKLYLDFKKYETEYYRALQKSILQESQ
ncbi:MAG: nucleotidyltransferase domain-containing protein [Candidatus Helarchaeota archaeon]|nr:nucleotidyltransferase domain-containing protein [Candidatus Helarchaeota archaeon]